MDAQLTNEAAVTRAPARLLEYRPGGFVAFPAHTTIALVEDPRIVEVPGVPYYCLGLMAWQGRWLPLVNLQALLRAHGEPQAAPRHVLVLAYQSAPGQAPEYGAVCAPLLVRMAEVADSQACELPQDSDLWPWISLACFTHEDHTVPVLDTARLFGTAHA